MAHRSPGSSPGAPGRGSRKALRPSARPRLPACPRCRWRSTSCGCAGPRLTDPTSTQRVKLVEHEAPQAPRGSSTLYIYRLDNCSSRALTDLWALANSARCPFTGSCGIDPGCPKPTWADLGEGEPHRCLKGPVPAISRVSWINAATITPPTTPASPRVDVEATQPATAFGVTSARRTPN